MPLSGLVDQSADLFCLQIEAARKSGSSSLRSIGGRGHTSVRTLIACRARRTRAYRRTTDSRPLYNGDEFEGRNGNWVDGGAVQGSGWSRIDLNALNGSTT